MTHTTTIFITITPHTGLEIGSASGASHVVYCYPFDEGFGGILDADSPFLTRALSVQQRHVTDTYAPRTVTVPIP